MGVPQSKAKKTTGTADEKYYEEKKSGGYRGSSSRRQLGKGMFGKVYDGRESRSTRKRKSRDVRGRGENSPDNFKNSPTAITQGTPALAHSKLRSEAVKSSMGQGRWRTSLSEAGTISRGVMESPTGTAFLQEHRQPSPNGRAADAAVKLGGLRMINKKDKEDCCKNQSVAEVQKSDRRRSEMKRTEQPEPSSKKWHRGRPIELTTAKCNNEE